MTQPKDETWDRLVSQGNALLGAFDVIQYINPPPFWADGIYMLANQRDEALDVVRKFAAVQAGPTPCPLCHSKRGIHDSVCLIHEARNILDSYPARREAQRRHVVERREGAQGRRRGPLLEGGTSHEATVFF